MVKVRLTLIITINYYFITWLFSFAASILTSKGLHAGTFNGMELWNTTSCGASAVANNVGASNIFSGGWPSGEVNCPLPTIGNTGVD